MFQNRTIPHPSIRPRVNMPQNSHIHLGRSPYFIPRAAVPDRRLKALFRINLINHRLSKRPELLSNVGTWAANHNDPNDIRARHGRKLSRALDVFTFFGIFLLFSMFGTAFAAITGDTVLYHQKRTSQLKEVLAPIVISGTIWSAPVNEFPQTNVTVYDPDGNVFMGSTTTNPTNGHYSLTVIPVGLEDKINKTEEMTVLGNPVMTEAKLGLTVLNQDNYTVRVFDISGKQLYNQRVNLAEGNNKITINGLGAPGLKIVEVTDGKKKYTAKVIQSEPTLFSPSISATATSGNGGSLKLKSTDYTTQLEFHFTPINPNYLPNIKTVPAQSGVVNDTVQGVSQTLNKSLHIYDVNGLPIAPGASPVASNYTLKAQFKDGTILQIPAVNGIININRTEQYPLITDTLVLIPDTITNHKFMEWMIGRKIHQQRYEPNVFQNEKQISPPGQYIPPGNVTVAVANMPSDMQFYVVPEKCLDPRNTFFSCGLFVSPTATPEGSYIGSTNTPHLTPTPEGSNYPVAD